MQRSRALGIGVLGALGLTLLGARAASGAFPAVPLGGPADSTLTASSVVNVDSESFPSHELFGYVPLRSASPLVLYQVPTDRWLLITDFETSGGTCQLVEIDGATETVKRGPFFFNSGAGGPVPFEGLHSSVGLAFAPGTQVALRNTSGVDTVVAFTLTGHLTRQ